MTWKHCAGFPNPVSEFLKVSDCTATGTVGRNGPRRAAIRSGSPRKRLDAAAMPSTKHTQRGGCDLPSL